MKKLNSFQIDSLYSFTQQHYVDYYDVQTELVDHLASGIEEQWQEDPDLPFEQALQKEFKKFGVYGFSDVVEKRVRTMEKKYFKLILKEISTLLTKPFVAFPVILLFLACYFVLKLENGFYYITYATFAYFLVLIIYATRKSYSLKQKKKSGKKILLLEAVICNAGSYLVFFYLPFQVVSSGLDSGRVENVYIQVLLSALISFLVLASYVCFYYLPKKKDEILHNAHSEIKFLQ
ncbi:hypothetical protein [Salinimicrobium terrae]|uniref:hypothetical protein n=1 Tax=Salinimicrobium terrae TaxID=470866 RepID=UPI00040DBF83|nr:hypothetical protein [Salinimicrobium terrae]